MYKLAEYQSIDAELKAIEQELSANEDRKKGIAAKKFLDTVNDSLAELDRKAAEFDNAYTKYTETFRKLSETQKEFDNVFEEYSGEDEINFVKKKAQELVDELKRLEKLINHLKEEILSITEQYNTLKKKTMAAQKQFKESGQKYTEFKASKAKAQEEIQVRLKALEKDIDPQALSLYKQRRADKIFPILYEYAGAGFCPHCRTEISKLAESNLSKSGIIVCDNCGRILYNNK
ncbi:MAG: hypothetical protein IJU84_10345 [Clostridia bacterium]|nr:hypothetical protein [Clostridia bacterium]